MMSHPAGHSEILAAVADASDDAIVVTDLDGIVLYWTAAATRLYGYTAEEIVGQSVTALWPEGHRGEIASILQHARAGERTPLFGAVGRTKPGRIVELSVAASPVRRDGEQVTGVALVVGDMTRRRRDERDARDTAQRWQSIVESAVDGIIVIDDHGVIEAFNPAAERLFGYAEADVVGRNVSILMPQPYRDEHDRYLGRYLREGAARVIGIGRDVKGQRRDGTVFPLHLSVGELSVDGQRKFTGILHDLSERVALEERLRTSEARWRAVIESAVDGIVVIDRRGRIEALNPAAERLFGYSESEALGRNVSVLMPEPYRSEHDGYLARYLREGAPRIIGTGREVSGRRRDGTTFPLHLSVGEMSIGGDRKFTGILHDLSQRVDMEERLREQAALVRLGEMAAVIAHEVKNPLAGVRGAIQVIGGRLPAGSKDSLIVREILLRIDALSDLMKDLLLFARPPRPKPSPVDLAPLVEITAHLLSEDPSLRDVQVQIDGSAPPVQADAEMLKIVFQNLLVNGAHAMHGQGTISVAIREEDGACRIAFTDQGPGIPAEVLEKIFTPFFTTKSRGSGLGLPTARRLIEAHNGLISVDCPTAGGTTVTIRLPTA
jgi:PAS domain S-box-containing protein